MNVENIRFHHQIKQVRSAFSRTDCQPANQLVATYQISFVFLKQLLKVGLLNLNDSVYYKGERWIREPDMSLDKFLTIARSKSVEPVLEQPMKPTVKNRQLQLDRCSVPSSLVEERNLAMNLKLAKREEWSGVLSWSTSHSTKVVDSIIRDDRQPSVQQEILEVKGKTYKIVDLEDHLEKALLEFFEGSLQLTLQRRTRKARN